MNNAIKKPARAKTYKTGQSERPELSAGGLMENTKRLVVCSRQSYKDTPFAVHAASCSDVERTEKRVNAASLHEIDGPVQKALDYILDEETRDMGYDESHVKVFPCCK